jgi:hypothetical protein
MIPERARVVLTGAQAMVLAGALSGEEGKCVDVID